MQIKEAIDAVKKEEVTARSLEKLVEARHALLPSLQRTITLPESASSPFFTKFLLDYIESVPDLLDAIISVSQEVGIYGFTKKFIEIAHDFFVQALELPCSGNNGLHTLIGEAYLAHRLFEELNDHIVACAGAPLLPLDFTAGNILVHELLGEEFGNQLDLAVHYSIESLFDSQQISRLDDINKNILHSKVESWPRDIEKWPCLATELNSELALKLVQQQDKSSESSIEETVH